MIGKRLANRYEIQRRIGDGGMAIVYRAHDVALDRPVAVKVLRPELARDEAFVRRFRREARAAASLSHPHIVAIYDVGRFQGHDYIVMEYVEGRTLKDRILREAPLPVPVAVGLARQICQALEHAHRHGVVHRDIKPQNILLTRGGQVKLTDLGIARATGSSTLVDASGVLGTAHYISPEQACGRFTGVPSDIYSLGVVLYEMLTGRLPFEGESPVTVAIKHVQEPPPPLRAHNPAVPATLEAIVLKAIEKDPARRYRSASELLADLERHEALAPEAVRAERPAARTIALPAAVPVGVPEAPARADATLVVGTVRPADAGPGGDGTWPVRARRQVRWRPPPWLLYALLALAVFTLAGGAAYGVSAWLQPALVIVPDLRGHDADQARALLQPLGVELRVRGEAYSDQVPAGRVLVQEPGPGERVRRGGRVEVTLSRGAELVPGGMPDLRGQARAAAEARLRALGLEAEVGYVPAEGAARDTVVDQRPEPGAEVPVGASVTLLVSEGPEAGAPFRLPDLRGRTLAEVQKALAELGLELGQVGTAPGDYPVNQVAAQTPGPGTLVRPGERVSVTVSAGNGLQPRQSTVRVELPAQPELQQVTVVVEDERGARIVRSDRYEGGSTFDVVVQWYGEQAVVRVLAEGRELTVQLPQD